MSSLSSTTEKPPTFRKRYARIALPAVLGILAVCAFGYYVPVETVVEIAGKLFSQPWFVPVFWGTLLALALAVRFILVRKRASASAKPGPVIEKSDPAVMKSMEIETAIPETLQPSRKFKTKHALGIGVILVAVAGIASVTLSGRFQTPDLPSWTVPVFWCLLLLLAAAPFFS